MASLEEVGLGIDAIKSERDRAQAERDLLLDALTDLVFIIDAAGLLNLSNGVQLGATSWYVKASDRLERSRAIIARIEGRES